METAETYCTLICALLREVWMEKSTSRMMTKAGTDGTIGIFLASSHHLVRTPSCREGHVSYQLLCPAQILPYLILSYLCCYVSVHVYPWPLHVLSSFKARPEGCIFTAIPSQVNCSRAYAHADKHKCIMPAVYQCDTGCLRMIAECQAVFGSDP